MADVKGALIGDAIVYGAGRFTGKKGLFVPGGADQLQLVRFYNLRGWNPTTSQWETWTSRSASGTDNPSGDPLTHVTQVPWERRVYFNEE